MLGLALFLAVGAGGGITFACSSNSDSGAGNANGDGGPLFAEAGTVDSAPPPPDYRDPRAADGACNPPNLVCGDAGGDDGGDSGFGGCTAVTLDHDNCGACDRACIGADSVCITGQCDCVASTSDYCVGVGCVDVTADINNCGSCGNVCDPNQFNACINAVCDNN